MKDEPTKETIKNFQFVFVINQKAIYEHLLNNNLDQTKIKPNEIYLISYLICFVRSNIAITQMVKGKKFYLVQDRFLRQNLIFLTGCSKTIGNMLNKLKTLKMITVENETTSKQERYLAVNDYLLSRWNINDNMTMTASEKIKRYRKEDWQIIQQEFGSYDNFELCLVYFDTDIRRQQTESVRQMAFGLYNYCKGAEISKTI